MRLPEYASHHKENTSHIYIMVGKGRKYTGNVRDFGVTSSNVCANDAFIDLKYFPVRVSKILVQLSYFHCCISLYYERGAT